MAKKPWEAKIVETNDQRLERNSKRTILSTPLLTALLAAFFLVVLVVLFIVFYTSNGGSNKTEETSGFYGAQSTSVSSSSVESSAAENISSSSETTQSTEASTDSTDDGATITVLSGEGAASIAARAGITVEQLQSLNPDHMTLGYWYANPGDVVKIK